MLVGVLQLHQSLLEDINLLLQGRFFPADLLCIARRKGPQKT